MAWKDHKSVSAAQKAGSMYFMGKDGKKKLAVTKGQLDAWKKRNAGKYKGSALTAWANAKGKDIKAAGSKGAPLRPSKPKGARTPEVETTSIGRADGGRGRMTTGEIRDIAETAIKKPPREYTYAEWKKMNRGQRKAAGLPESVLGGEMGFKRWLTGITGKEYTRKGYARGGLVRSGHADRRKSGMFK